MDPTYYNPTLKRSCKPMKRKKPINRVSKRGRARNKHLGLSHAMVTLRSGGRCEAPFRLSSMLIIPKEDRDMILADPFFQAMKESVFKPKRCNAPVDIPPHHIKPRSKGRDDSPANLLALCLDCHRWTHNNPKQAREIGVLK